MRPVGCGVVSSSDGFGVAFDFLPPAEFCCMVWSSASTLQPIGPAAGNAVQLTIWRAADADLKDQAKAKLYARNTFLAWIPDRLLVPMRDHNRSIRTVDTTPQRFRLL